MHLLLHKIFSWHKGLIQGPYSRQNCPDLRRALLEKSSWLQHTYQIFVELFRDYYMLLNTLDLIQQLSLNVFPPRPRCFVSLRLPLDCTECLPSLDLFLLLFLDT